MIFLYYCGCVITIYTIQNVVYLRKITKILTEIRDIKPTIKVEEANEVPKVNKYKDWIDPVTGLYKARKNNVL